jgi:hypothetical protein
MAASLVSELTDLTTSNLYTSSDNLQALEGNGNYNKGNVNARDGNALSLLFTTMNKLNGFESTGSLASLSSQNSLASSASGASSPSLFALFEKQIIQQYHSSQNLAGLDDSRIEHNDEAGFIRKFFLSLEEYLGNKNSEIPEGEQPFPKLC